MRTAGKTTEQHVYMQIGGRGDDVVSAERFPLPSGVTVVLGSASEEDFAGALEREGVGRYHARIEVEANGLRLRVQDENSSFGTFHSGFQLVPRRIYTMRLPTELQLGQHCFVRISRAE